jgi:hypothetical protein
MKKALSPKVAIAEALYWLEKDSRNSFTKDDCHAELMGIVDAIDPSGNMAVEVRQLIEDAKHGKICEIWEN